MKERYPLFIFYLLAILLIVEPFLNDDNFYEFLKFTSTSVFLWKGIIINKSNQNKFSFISLALLFNPFYDFNIDKDFFRILFLITGICIFVIQLFIFDRNKISAHISYNKEIYLKLFIVVLIFVGFIHISNNYQEEQKHQEYLVELENIKNEELKNDSIKSANFKLNKERNEKLEKTYCIESEALKYFKERMELYNPQFAIKTTPKIKNDGNCIFTISCTVQNNKYQYLSPETLICTIDLNYDGEFNQYKINYIDKPLGFN